MVRRLWLVWMLLAAVRANLREEQLALATRRRVYEAVLAQPGSHISEVARATALQPSHAQYHLERLVKADLLTVAGDGGMHRFYPRDERGNDRHGRDAKRILAAMRRPTPLRIILALLRLEDAALNALAERTGKRPSTLVYHLDRLVDEGVVERQGRTHVQRTYRLCDAAKVMALLMSHPPRYDLVSAFIDMWEGLALPAPVPDLTES